MKGGSGYWKGGEVFEKVMARKGASDDWCIQQARPTVEAREGRAARNAGIQRRDPTIDPRYELVVVRFTLGQDVDAPTDEYEVEVEVRRTFTVRATSEDEASEIGYELFDDGRALREYADVVACRRIQPKAVAS